MYAIRSYYVYKGEHNLDNLRMSFDKVIKVWLEPEVEANLEAIESVLDSEVIILAPGSMYGSVLINLLPKGMRSAWKRTKAKKILMTNIMSVANENYDFDQEDYVDIFAKYLDVEKPFDEVLIVITTYSIHYTKLYDRVNFSGEFSRINGTR